MAKKKTCSCQSKSHRRHVSGVGRIGKMNTKSITAGATAALMVAGGFMAANFLKNKVSFLSANPAVGSAVALAGGFFLSGQGGAMKDLGTGMMGAGAVGLVKTLVPSLDSAISGIQNSSDVHYVAGYKRRGVGAAPVRDVITVD